MSSSMPWAADESTAHCGFPDCGLSWNRTGGAGFEAWSSGSSSRGALGRTVGQGLRTGACALPVLARGPVVVIGPAPRARHLWIAAVWWRDHPRGGRCAAPGEPASTRGGLEVARWNRLRLGVSSGLCVVAAVVRVAA